jgi:dipeptidyl aminopeptidase/acylaminoacyl peptidase
MPADSSAPRRVTLNDLLDLKLVSDPQLSPDGRRLAWVVGEANKTDTPKPRSRVWAMALDGGSPRPLTGEHHTDAAPRWSPDGRHLLFISDRKEAGKPRLYLMPVGGPESVGGEAELLWPSVGDVSQPCWSADGRRVACLMTDLETDEQRKRKERKDDPQVFDEEPRFDRLWVVDLETRRCSRSGSTRCVTGERVHVWEFDESPDGSRFVALVSDRRGEDAWYSARLVTVPAAGGEATLLCTTGKQYAMPRWSPDGRWIAFLSCTWSDRGVIGGDMWVVSADGAGEPRLDAQRQRRGPDPGPRNLTAGSSVSVSCLAWEPESAGILFLGYGEGQLTAGRVDRDTGATERFWTEPITAAERSQPRFTLDRTAQTMALAREDPAHPRDLWTYSRAGGWQRRTELHLSLANISWGAVEELSWQSADGRAIQGLVVHPVDAPRSAVAPLIVLIHGGPASLWPYRLAAGGTSDWAQWLAAHGYRVLLPNPRGSLGWGVPFTEANLGDMGGRDLQDILAGVEALVEAGLADPARIGIGGWSYGGYMTAWAVTRPAAELRYPFRAAVMGAGIANWLSFHGTAEIPAWDALFWQASPYERDGPYQQFSPIHHIQNARTPTLILHGGDDHTVPASQAQEFYQALKERAVPTQLVLYPREGHPIQEREHQRDMLERILAWYNQHLLG